MPFKNKETKNIYFKKYMKNKRLAEKMIKIGFPVWKKSIKSVNEELNELYSEYYYMKLYKSYFNKKILPKINGIKRVGVLDKKWKKIIGWTYEF